MIPCSKETTLEQLRSFGKLFTDLKASSENGLRSIYTFGSFYNTASSINWLLVRQFWETKIKPVFVLSISYTYVTAKIIQYGSTRCVKIAQS